MCVLPVTGCETWVFIDKMIRKLRIARKAMVRLLIGNGKQDKTKNQSLDQSRNHSLMMWAR